MTQEKVPIPIDLPGMDEELRRDVELRVEEFEKEYTPRLLKEGKGWVPKIRLRDYIIAIVINALVVIWLIIALVGG